LNHENFDDDDDPEDVLEMLQNASLSHAGMIAESVVPFAVRWYLDQALEHDEAGADSDDSDDDSDDSDSSPKKKSKGKKKKGSVDSGNAANIFAGQGGQGSLFGNTDGEKKDGDNKECNQQ